MKPIQYVKIHALPYKYNVPLAHNKPKNAHKLEFILYCIPI